MRIARGGTVGQRHAQTSSLPCAQRLRVCSTPTRPTVPSAAFFYCAYAQTAYTCTMLQRVSCVPRRPSKSVCNARREALVARGSQPCGTLIEDAENNFVCPSSHSRNPAASLLSVLSVVLLDMSACWCSCFLYQCPLYLHSICLAFIMFTRHFRVSSGPQATVWAWCKQGPREFCLLCHTGICFGECRSQEFGTRATSILYIHDACMLQRTAAAGQD